jgi:Ulp1 family protease
MKLLQNLDKNVFIYPTSFYKDLMQIGYNSLPMIYKSDSLINLKKLYIPIFKENHCFLITCDKSEIILLDPYDFSGIMGDRNEDYILESYQNHMKLIISIKDLYFKPLFTSSNQKFPDFKLSIFLPPKIPSQNVPHDCGVFLAMFVKYSILNKEIDFDNEHCISIRESMRTELLAKKIEDTKFATKKRKHSTQRSKSNSSKRRKSPGILQGLHRTFRNLDNESCWINSCLQLVLTAFDHQTILRKSTLGTPNMAV